VEKVVYFLGAGFSAPLGLPVMSNFLEKSKDMYFTAPERYEHFKRVFDRIAEYSVVKNYLDTDLFNIEEILSILEIGWELGSKRGRKEFLRYLRDVIVHYTPEITPYEGNLPSNWDEFVFGKDTRARVFGCFTLALLNVEIRERRDCGSVIPRDRFKTSTDRSRATRYDVISLNYDQVLESFCDFYNQHMQPETPLGFRTEFSDTEDDRPSLCKLHGCVSKDNIVPPTWRKGVNPSIRQAWTHAYNLLVNANHLRIIGYSLADADAYVRYLFKAALMKAPHLKSIDVLCRDSSGTIRDRYDAFITFPNRRFLNADVTEYLNQLATVFKRRRDTRVREPACFRGFEEQHGEFWRTSPAS